ncbi:MAG: hypothetical protein ACI8T1_002004 [Verrucomicrobiales bacterium]|jgi:hypothetical protein
MKRFASFLALSLSFVPLTLLAADDVASKRLEVLLIDGQNNHDWERTTTQLVEAVKAAKIFEITVTTSPTKENWDQWKIDFSKYDVVLNNYYGDPWPKPISDGLLAFLEKGGGLVNVHAANNAFPNWPEFNQITGLLWRDPMGGDRLYYDDQDKLIREPRGEGIGAGHGSKHPFVVRVREPNHPIMNGFPTEWLHAFDELYHGQRGPAKNMTILSSAYADPGKGGSGKHEPMTWVIPHGEGRVVTTVLGHLWKGQKELDGLRCVGFHTILVRSLQYAAGEKVTVPIPDDFPKKDKASIVPVK